MQGYLLLCHRPSGPPTLPITLPITTSSSALSSTKGDDDGDGGDDWYDDYDDFVSKLDFEGGGWDSGADSPFEGSDDRGGGRGRGGRGGGGRGGGRSGGRGGRGGDFGGHDYYSDKGGHDYQRDSRDDSEVDVNAVDELLASRLHYRKKRLFDAADDIRVSRLLLLGSIFCDIDRVEEEAVVDCIVCKYYFPPIDHCITYHVSSQHFAKKMFPISPHIFKDELLNVHGVTVWDKDRTWTTAKNSVGRGLEPRGRRGEGGRGRGGGGGVGVSIDSTIDSTAGAEGAAVGEDRGEGEEGNRNSTSMDTITPRSEDP